MIGGVLLLGWGAAERRHLRPYASVYTKRGLAVRSEILDPAVTRGKGRMPEEIARIAARARELDGDLLVHMFSRVGFITYAALLDASGGARLRQRVVAHVFDSGPGVPQQLTPGVYAEQMASGIARAALGRSWLARIAQPPLRMALRAQYQLVPEVRQAYADARARFAALAPVAPTLCLYSRADAIVDYQRVERFAACERRRGASVELCAFRDSRHVQHLRLHPARYSAALSQFLVDRGA